MEYILRPAVRRASVPFTPFRHWSVRATCSLRVAMANDSFHRSAKMQECCSSSGSEVDVLSSNVATLHGQPAVSEVSSYKASQFGTLLNFSSSQVALGGHRGMGMNHWSASKTHSPGHFRENTVKSLQQATFNGATFVEFDVQTTADGVPVIWHDNYIVFGDPANPISKLIRELTYTEFCELAPVKSTGVSNIMSLGDSPPCGEKGMHPAHSRSASGLSSSSTWSTQSSLLRKLHNHSPATPEDASLATWECIEDDYFPTLEQVFTELPANVAFDIEIKMSTPETVEHTPAEEVARQLDAILAVVDEQLALAPRLILFSSFDPEICTELKRRRPEFPVMFLSGAGAYKHVDCRRTSIPGAINFAAVADLNGIILETSMLMGQLHMVETARNRGLQVMTYGTANDNPEWVRKQFYHGVHGVIVDDVAGVAMALSSALSYNG